MDAFWTDLVNELNNYYDSIVDLLPRMVLAILAFLIASWLGGWLQRFSKSSLSRRVDDPLLADFLARIIRLTILAIGFLIVLRIVGLGGVAASLLGAAGVGAFIIGFAFKDIGENFLAGFIMAFNRPFRVGDMVKFGDIAGKIVGLNLRYTQIKTLDGKDAYVPNGAIIKNTIVNYTIDGYLRYDFTIGLDYDSDIPKAINVILGTLTGVEGVLTTEKKPFVMVDELASSTINLRILFWVDTLDEGLPDYETKNRAMYQTVIALSEAGFGMPSDIIEIKNYKEGELLTKNRTEDRAA